MSAIPAETGEPCETPQQSARRLSAAALRDGYKPEALHEYQTADGKPWCWRIRLKHPNGAKWIRPMCWNGSAYVLGEPPAPPEGKPLYRLPELLEAPPDAPVFVVEGEQCADALAKLGIPATTSGSCSSADAADWTSAKGRSMIEWPDNDGPGAGYAGAVVAKLRALGCDVRLIAREVVESLPDGGDVVDWLAAHPNATRADVLALPTAEPAEDACIAERRPVVVDVRTLLTMELPPREELLSPWLTSQSLSMIHAWRGVGKTHVALGIAYALASGGDFLRWHAAHPVPVLYLDGEMPGAALKGRLAHIVEATEKEAADGFLRVMTPDLQPDGIMPDLATPEGQRAIEAELGNARVIIVDNISCLVRATAKENDAESWAPVATWALRQRAHGRAVVFIHHSGKGGTQRGTSKREDLLDTVIRLSHPADYRPDEGARFTVEFEKYRPRPGAATDAFEANLEPGADGLPTWVMKDAAGAVGARVVALAELGMSNTEIATELGCNRSTVYRNVRAAQDDGRLPVSRKRNKYGTGRSLRGADNDD